jgi:leucyl/phenylalanyl-tRNA--protein transferase
MARIPWIAANDDDTPFPDVEAALSEPNGLLAIGGSLTPGRLLAAYRHGIFPWFSADQPVLWWSPDPRAVMTPGEMRLTRSLRKRLRQGRFRVSADTAFREVMEACAEPRPGQAGTWITADMMDAYETLHRERLGHSVEVWQERRLVGGLYGVSLGGAFFGESMFSIETDASKVALAWLLAQLRRWGFPLLDCQMPTPHLQSLGACIMPRRQFTVALRRALRHPTRQHGWHFDDDLDPAEAGAGSP